MDELFKNNNYRILELFIEYPIKEFSVRGIARNLNLSHATVINYIDGLVNLEVIKKKNETLYPTYYANIENPKFIWYKRNYIVYKIMNSGLVGYIYDKTLASSIILFGSCAKGVFTEKSDVDIFVEANQHNFELREYEKKLGRAINLIYEPNINTLSKELRNNIINGVILYGFVNLK
jgi:predicted nucleotidyltransferase